MAVSFSLFNGASTWFALTHDFNVLTGLHYEEAPWIQERSSNLGGPTEGLTRDVRDVLGPWLV